MSMMMVLMRMVIIRNTKIFLVDLIWYTETNLKWQLILQSHNFSPKHDNFSQFSFINFPPIVTIYPQ